MRWRGLQSLPLAACVTDVAALSPLACCGGTCATSSTRSHTGKCVGGRDVGDREEELEGGVVAKTDLQTIRILKKIKRI